MDFCLCFLIKMIISKSLEFGDKRGLFKSFVRVVQSLFKLKELSDQELELLSFVYTSKGFKVSTECLKEFRQVVGVNSRVSSQLVKRVKAKGYLVSYGGEDFYLIKPLCLDSDSIELKLKFRLSGNKG